MYILYINSRRVSAKTSQSEYAAKHKYKISSIGWINNCDNYYSMYVVHNYVVTHCSIS